MHKSHNGCSPFWEFKYHDQVYTTYHCAVCDLVFYDPFPQINYENHTETDISIKDYVHLNCNITGIINILLNNIPENSRSILEVGCGFGFGLDFAKNILGMEVVGFEPSTYGEMGSKELGVDIRRTYLTADSLPGKKFDVIFLSEVLEHITEPGDFLELLKSYLSDNGVMILTTPNYESLKKDINNSTDLAVLSPGAHLLLFSVRSLKELLQKCGFQYVEIKADGSLIAIASAAPVRWKEFKNKSALITQYYEDLLHRIKPNQLSHTGIVFRLFQNYIEHSNYAEAARLLNTHPFPELPSMQNIFDIKRMEQLYEPWTVSSGIFYYYRGILALNYEGDFTAAAHYFSAGFLLCRKKLFLIPQYSVMEQALIWTIKFHEVISLYHAGSYTLAIKEANEIINHKANPANCSLPSPEAQLQENTSQLINSIPENYSAQHKQPVLVLQNTGAQKAKEIQDWYNKEYEVLPLWYKRFGHIIKIIMGKRSLFKK